LIRRWLRSVMLLLPALAVACVGAAWLFTQIGGDARGARLYAGPYSTRILALRAVVAQKHALGELPLSLPVEWVVTQGRQTMRRDGASDQEGVVELNLPLALGEEPPVVELRVRGSVSGSQPGQLLSVTRFAAVGTRPEVSMPTVPTLGGWLSAAATGALEIQVGLETGVLAVPFSSRLWIKVTEGGNPASMVPLSVNLSGAEPALSNLQTNADGVASLALLPTEHSVELSVVAGQGLHSSRLLLELPVVPGALFAELIRPKRIHAAESRDSTQLQGSVLRVSSATPRSSAYLSLILGDEVLALTHVSLREEGTFYTGELELSALSSWGLVPPRGQGDLGVHGLKSAIEPSLWAVVSSEPDAASPALVGWPLGPATGPRRNFNARLRLVADGVQQNSEQRAQLLNRVRDWVLWGLAAALGIELLLLHASLRADNQIQMLGEVPLPPVRGAATALALLVLGFSALMSFVWFAFGTP
jgi:hypothetical protein